MNHYAKYFNMGKWMYMKLHFPLSPRTKDDRYYKVCGWACGHGKVWYNSDRCVYRSELISCTEEEAL